MRRTDDPNLWDYGPPYEDNRASSCRFFRDLAASAVQVADELDPPPPADGGTDVSPLGFLQRSIASQSG